MSTTQRGQLSHRQRQCYEAIKRLRRPAIQPGPTVRELADELGVASTHAVRELLDRLEEKGYIERGSGAREIRVLIEDADTAAPAA